MRSSRPSLTLDLGDASAAVHEAPASVEKFLYGQHFEPVVLVGVCGLVLDERIQPRERVDPAKIREYAELLAEAMAEGRDPAEVFDDPLIVYVDSDGTQRVAEGFHRTSAAREAQATMLRAILRPGGIAAARLWSAGSNKGHGLPRTAEDKRRVLLWFLDDAKGQVTLTPEALRRLPEAMRARVRPGETVDLSDGLIGHLCQVSQSTVSRLRAKLRSERAGAGAPAGAAATHAAHDLPGTRMGLDGRRRQVRALAAPDLAAARRNDDADPARGKPAAPAEPRPEVRPGPDGDTRDPRQLVNWQALGQAWARNHEVPQEDEALRRSLAGAFKLPLDAAKWAASIVGGQGDKVRNMALHGLVAGARGR